MRFFLLVAALVGSSLAIWDPFMQWARENNKQYLTKEEQAHRREIWENNYQSMLEHNAKYEAGEVTWSRKVTEYYDLTTEEFIALRTGLPQYDESSFVDQDDHVDQVFMDKLDEMRGNAPAEVNWISEGVVTSVKNQGQCGSCAHFSSVAVLDTCFQMASGTLYDDLSEQHLVDCTYNHYYNDDAGSWGSFGCDGAWPPAILEWLYNNGGGHAQTEASYPYEHTVRNCRSSSGQNYNGAKITGMYNKWYTNDNQMRDLVAINPVSTSMDASYLGDYHQGIIDDSRCCNQVTDPNCRYNLNHAVTVVGYGTQNGMDYWLVKNSWGRSFGENGFFKIKRGTGHCGIGSLHITSAYCQ